MRICMFTSSFLPTIGGLQFQVKWLAEELARQGEEVYLLTPKDTGKYIDKQQNNFPKNINLNFDTSFVRVKRYLCNTLKLLKAINKIKPDIIHIHCALPDGLYVVLAKFLQKTPLVITSHGADVVKIKEISYGYRLNPIYSLIIRSVLQLCDKHVLVSHAMVKYAQDAGSSNHKIVVIPNGIPPRKCVSEEKVNEVREKYGISPDEKTLLTLSGMRPLKGLKYLLRAMPEILKENPNTRLIMTGKGRYMTYLESLISNLNIRHEAKFLGFVHEEEKIALTKLCDIFCLPSVFEPFGIVLLEAMQFEKSIVASNVGGPPEVIENEKNGLLVPPKSPEAISKAINLLLADENLRTKLGKEASKHVKIFDIKNIAKKYISLYRETIKYARIRRHKA